MPCELSLTRIPVPCMTNLQCVAHTSECLGWCSSAPENGVSDLRQPFVFSAPCINWTEYIAIMNLCQPYVHIFQKLGTYAILQFSTPTCPLTLVFCVGNQRISDIFDPNNETLYLRSLFTKSRCCSFLEASTLVFQLRVRLL